MTISERRDRLQGAHLYAILDTGYVAHDRLLFVAEQLVKGGVDLIQFRAKGMMVSEIVRTGQELRSLIPASGPLFILNDHPGLVEDIDADGVHVGQDDMSIDTTREQAGTDRLVGKSTHSVEQALAAEQDGADYIGVGPLFATPTKPDYKPVGVGLIDHIQTKVRIPQFCIGGINESTLSTVLDAGGKRVVIVSALLQSSDIPAFCERIRQELLTRA